MSSHATTLQAGRASTSGGAGAAQPSAFEEYRNRRHFSALDGLRCASIVAVLCHHTWHGWDWLPMTQKGFLGVDMFFTISGFLIVTLLLRERAARGQICLRNFYARRFLRIFPLYYGVLAILTVVFLIRRTGSEAAPFFHSLPFYLTYTSNWVNDKSILTIAWSLAAEEQFYLLWPPAERFLPGRVVLGLLALLLVVNQLMNFGLLGAILPSTLSIVQITFTPICAGVLLAHLLHSPRGFAWAARWMSRPWAVLAPLAGLLIFCNLPGDISGLPRLLIHVLMAALLACCVMREDTAISGVLRWAPFRRIGIVSYGIYLLHMLVRDQVDRGMARLGLSSRVVLFVLTLLLTWGVAEISYRSFEQYFLRLKSRFSASAQPAAAEVPVPAPGAGGGGGAGARC